MTQDTDSRLIVASTIERHLLKDDEIIGAIFLGSFATSDWDEYSDLDIYLYTEAWWPRRKLARWLRAVELEPDLHYWTGLGKHRLLVSGARVDITFWLTEERRQVALWPQIFFPRSAIVKDTGGVLVSMWIESQHAPAVVQENDYASYILKVIDVGVQIARGEIVNARSRIMGVLEARARVMRELPLGSARWREPTRRVEADLSPDEVKELSNIAFIGNERRLRQFIFEELVVISEDDAVKENTRSVAWRLAQTLQDETLRRTIR